ncbi:glycoside hydrolase family 3 C-terminal domain-containing protein [Amycolatopsis sp. DG1A-15b]|uniref:glycoside hydrolase family 3 C-terminal domain-containing protein n=1 Tax=Amycolatopsis sp. DG1A-15b TaxID=3052846 RepID=UPI00255C0748|nr:glycoside hydrolase family 3 C-terminal domain-containing protein [Amycolatopsis sp. DG1A-15b]WIX91948.1 glycoside hydrolase family 3 C-terminal domain-containing protein [Amycolatopsis sp. DG1A-15b]
MRRRLALGAVAVAGLLAVPPVTAEAAPALLSQGHAVTASSTENAAVPASAAVDGDPGTRWSSLAADPQTLQVDLGSVRTLNQVVLQWEAAYATAFTIQASADAGQWSTVYSTTTGTGGTQTLPVSGSGRYVRLTTTRRATQWGVSLWEFQVFGDGSAQACGSANAALRQPATASSVQSEAFPASAAVDGDGGTRWSSLAADPQWIQVDLGGARAVCGVDLTWETAYASAYTVQLSTDGTSWTTAATVTGAGGTEHPAVSGRARYVRVNATARATPWGVSLWEFAVHTSDSAPPTTGCPWVGSTAPVADRVNQLMAVMTAQQKVKVLHGNGATGPYIGNTDAVPELCIPALGLQDGPAGVGDGLDGVTQFPAPVSAAATWDTALVNRYGSAMGAEFAGKGVDIALGPTINLVRDPRWGRNFETYSEDPYLAGAAGTATVQGIQSQGVLAQAKHAAAYNVEAGASRGTPSDNVIIDDRTLHELYLPAFQQVASQGQVASMMCAYNQINGVPACQNSGVLTTAIKQDANWGGFVGSDWGSATGGPRQLANGGLDMEMPGGAFFGQGLLDAVSRGEVTQARVDDMVRRVLTQMFRFGLFDRARRGTPASVVTNAANVATARDVAAAGSVLLKNTGVLPLGSSVKSIALSGGDAIDPQNIGGGSAKVNPSPASVNPIDGIKARAGSGVAVSYVDGAGEHVQTPDIPGAVAAARTADVAIVFGSYGESETQDLDTIDLQNQQNELIDAVASANPRTVVVLNTGSAVTMPWLGKVAAVIEGWYPGQENGNALASLLYGDVNPSGKLPISFPKQLADLPTANVQQFPGANDRIEYSEGLNVGYRWYDSRNLDPLFPFGFGLSYTTFGFSNLVVTPQGTGGTATVTATVTNTGTRAGADVVQLYVGQPAGNGEPPKQLKGFKKVQLNPGQSAQVSFPLTPRDLAHWTGSWTANAGQYRVYLGDSSRNVPLSATLTVS